MLLNSTFVEASPKILYLFLYLGRRCYLKSPLSYPIMTSCSPLSQYFLSSYLTLLHSSVLVILIINNFVYSFFSFHAMFELYETVSLALRRYLNLIPTSVSHYLLPTSLYNTSFLHSFS